MFPPVIASFVVGTRTNFSFFSYRQWLCCQLWSTKGKLLVANQLQLPCKLISYTANHGHEIQHVGGFTSCWVNSIACRLPYKKIHTCRGGIKYVKVQYIQKSSNVLRPWLVI